MNVGKAIKVCRTQRGWNQSTLAQRANISISHVSKVESGKRDPTMSVLQSVSDALDVPLMMLMFIASSDDELKQIDIKTREKIAHESVKMLKG